jgi:lysophospholipase L1-like esterase
MRRINRRTLLTSVAAAAPVSLAAACGTPAAQRVRGVPQAPVPTASPTPATLLRPPLTYVAIGASDTAGVGVEDPAHEAWVNVLAQALPQPVEVLNLGISGATALDAVEQELPPALQALQEKSGLVTVWLVVNDLLLGVPLDTYRRGLDRLLGDLRTKTDAQVAIGNAPDPPPNMDYLRVPGVPAAQRRALVETWNATIADLAAQHGAVLVDVFSRWPVGEHPEFIGPDRFHPSAVGYRALADVFRQTLAEQRII